jgi:hypothetical protein
MAAAARARELGLVTEPQQEQQQVEWQQLQQQSPCTLHQLQQRAKRCL